MGGGGNTFTAFNGDSDCSTSGQTSDNLKVSTDARLGSTTATTVSDSQLVFTATPIDASVIHGQL